MEVNQKREKRESPVRIFTCVFSVSNTLTILSLVTVCQVKWQSLYQAYSLCTLLHHLSKVQIHVAMLKTHTVENLQGGTFHDIDFEVPDWLVKWRSAPSLRAGTWLWNHSMSRAILQWINSLWCCKLAVIAWLRRSSLESDFTLRWRGWDKAYSDTSERNSQCEG